MMFEGGSEDDSSLYEGGSDDEDNLNDEDGAETVKPKGKKKKSKRRDTFKSKDTGVTQKLDESAYNNDT